ncbi:MAG: dihydroneopterin aldolase [Pseudomonadota bacterium]
MSKASITAPFPRPKRETCRKVFLRDLTVDAFIGVHAHEHDKAQPLAISITMEVASVGDPLSERYEDIVCYEKISNGVKDIIAEGHVRLVETLGERIAALCLAHALVERVVVHIEKPDALPGATVAGVEIIREKAH